MNSLIAHARRELSSAGFTSTTADYGGKMAEDILALITLFAAQGHSGGSAAGVATLFQKLVRFEPLGPLTGADNEWAETPDPGVFQNIRCSRVLRRNGVAVDLCGTIWVDSNGATYTNSHSATEIKFPYTPTSVTKPSSEDPGRQPYTQSV